MQTITQIEEAAVGKRGKPRGEPRSQQQVRNWAAIEVRGAVRRGELPALDGSIICSNCRACPAVLFDHRDYGRPLDVCAVCKRCNKLLGPGKMPKALPRFAVRDGRPHIHDDLRALVSTGRSLARIGAFLGISRERVRQLIWSYGLREQWIEARHKHSPAWFLNLRSERKSA